MQRSELKHVNCSVAQTLEVVADWWSFLILRDCFCGVRTFDRFQSSLNISTSMLSVRLKHLTTNGILERIQSAGDGRSFEYSLTQKGLDLYPIIVAMVQWGEKWHPNPNGPRIEFFEKATGTPIQGTRLLSEDGHELTARQVNAWLGPGADGSPLEPSLPRKSERHQ